ncbi:hat2p [Saccharomyces arboricola H-6]|uniref:Hat2p n=1 Tax=Saccharomyces arboricola (strain H-6 / AS 2.3317 / CBS 10644) TaxID=1160507 RepID=J8Q944_SACAR|nr:hat2p [Saccharomyces arboricola H-6]
METQGKPLSVDEEYDLWKSNVPLMYDFVSETRLTWPSLTVQWLPTPVQEPENGIIKQELIIGTHTSGEEENYLKFAEIDLPKEILTDEDPQEETEKDDEASTPPPRSNIKITAKYEHKEEITKARYMPQDPNIVATINGQGTVFLYSRAGGLQSTLKFHKDNGYALSFNPLIKGQLLSGSDDHTVALWDANGSSDSTTPIRSWNDLHTDIVNDSKWHNFNEALFGTVSEDSFMKINDTRVDNTTIDIVKCPQPFNTLAFSHHSSNLLAAAGMDSHVYLYDLRNMDEPLHHMSGHEDAVTNLEFSPHVDGVVVSSGSDNRLIMWDLKQIGAEQTPDDAEDGVSELIMIHAGHRSAVNDFDMNLQIPWLVASTEEENILQVWKCSHSLPVVGGPPKVNKDIIS